MKTDWTDDELAGIDEALRQEFEQACREAPVPSAGLVWWRANIRARADAARRVEQPLTIAPAIAGAAVVGGAAGVAGIVWRVVPTGGLSSPFVIAGFAVGVFVVLAPLALVFALARD